MAWDLLCPPMMDLVSGRFGLPLADTNMAAPLTDLAVAALRPLVLLVLVQLYAVGAGGADADAKCSKALGFNESSEPKDRSAQDLHFCTEHHKRTCCEKNHTRSVLTKFSTFSHERSPGCVQMTRLVLCSSCDGDVGVGMKARLNNVLLCPSFCRQWFKSCFDDYFTSSSSGELHPCGPSSLVCSPLKEITDDYASFCSRVGGFAVADGEDDVDSCYDGIPAARTRGKGPRAVWIRPEPRVPPWWKRWLMSVQNFRLAREIEAYVPGMVVGTVVSLVAWYVLRGGDD